MEITKAIIEERKISNSAGGKEAFKLFRPIAYLS
jgi:hypothetical protein